MTAVRSVYRVIRSILFAAILIMGALLLLLYVILSTPAVQNGLCNIAQKELSDILNAPVKIGAVDFHPFNELQLEDIEIRTPDNKPCIRIDRLGAGIAFWKLLTTRNIEITYAEVIGLKARIAQTAEGKPFNIQFIIDAFKPKEEGKPPTRFDLKLHNIVIRKSSVRFDREWKPESDKMPLDVNHLSVYNLRADVALPRLSNDDIQIDLRRLSFSEKSNFYLDGLSLKAIITPNDIKLSDFDLRLGDSNFTINNQEIRFNGFKNLVKALKDKSYDLQLTGRNITPSDFGFLSAQLRNLQGVYNLDLSVIGSPDDFNVNNFELSSEDGKVDVQLIGNLKGAISKDINVTLPNLDVSAEAEWVSDILNIVPDIDDRVHQLIANTRHVNTRLKGAYDAGRRAAYLSGDISVVQGSIAVDSKLNWSSGFSNLLGDVKVNIDRFDMVSMLIPYLPKEPIGELAADIEAKFSLNGKNINAMNAEMSAFIPLLTVNGEMLTDLSLDGSLDGKNIKLTASASTSQASGVIDVDCVIDGSNSQWSASGSIPYFDASALGLLPEYPAIVSLESFDIRAIGNNLDNIAGNAVFSGFRVNPRTGKEWGINHLRLLATEKDGFRTFNVDSDILKCDVSGHYRVSDVKDMTMEILSYTLPAYIQHPIKPVPSGSDMRFVLIVNNNEDLFNAFDLKYRPLVPVSMDGSLNSDTLRLSLEAPYIMKGGDKLIKNTSLLLESDRDNGSNLSVSSQWPVKKGYINLDVKSNARENHLVNNVGWKFDYNDDAGEINLDVDIDRPVGEAPVYSFNIKESDLKFNNVKWFLSPANAVLSDKILSVDNLRISGNNQFVNISGRASANPADTLRAELNDIDLSYIFNTLNINYVTFAGRATGTAVATNLFGRNPYATTQGLHVRNFSYNNACVGDADLLGFWDNERKSVGIGARITEDNQLRGVVKGDIFVTRDSLGINFDVNKINLALIQPFLSNILEDVKGQATANLTLYGNFKNITLVGDAFADTASVKLGFTNVTYHGRDSVKFLQDAIVIPGFRVYDKYGHSAVFSGDVKHNYFHDARVNFDIKNVKNLLAYDTDASSGDVWYGHIFATGSGRVSGVPGYTQLSFDVNTNPNSSFTFVLDETETVGEYSFLTFTDSRKKRREIITEETIEEVFRKKMNEPLLDEYSVLDMDISVGINPGLKVNVIMDPSSGDKIEARGNGALRLHYDTSSDEVGIFGRYVLDEGSYQFRFQDLILRDFSIRPGSTISFNGDPMRGMLDLTAAYRVNTNLTDLDKSFSTDRDLNRSSVPVDALLKVSGEMTSPDIDFDISIPTVTAEVERKVRSIISSDEMMQQQVLYLLALNRFYTPQFSGNSDGELMSVASSTLSSQVANVLSQLTDKVTLNPSFKSDRSDLSDMEVDLALSSQLFDNRLIINGNLGYRDRSVSQTNFIGDFDIEYLLSKDGRLRLKAYNHFNDAYYYLKSALTTQGVGIIYRKDFDDAFSFLRPKKRKKVFRIPNVTHRADPSRVSAPIDSLSK